MANEWDFLLPEAAKGYAQGKLATDPYAIGAKGLGGAKFEFDNPWAQIAAQALQGFGVGATSQIAQNRYDDNLSKAYAQMLSNEEPTDPALKNVMIPIQLAKNAAERQRKEKLEDQINTARMGLISSLIPKALEYEASPAGQLEMAEGRPNPFRVAISGLAQQQLSTSAQADAPTGEVASSKVSTETAIPPPSAAMPVNTALTRPPVAGAATEPYAPGLGFGARKLKDEAARARAEERRKTSEDKRKIEDSAREYLKTGSFPTQFSDLKNNFLTMQDTYGFNDIAGTRVFIQAFARTLDPGSVVMPGEISRAENTQSFLASLGYKLESLVDGTQRLDPKARLAMLRAAGTKYNRFGSDFTKLVEKERGRVKSYGGNAENVYPQFDYEPFDFNAFAANPPPVQTVEEQLATTGKIPQGWQKTSDGKAIFNQATGQFQIIGNSGR